MLLRPPPSSLLSPPSPRRHENGSNCWSRIKSDPEFSDALARRTNVDLKDKWANVLKKEKKEKARRQAWEEAYQGASGQQSLGHDHAKGGPYAT